MHTVALTRDSKIVTWGGNDLGALGRDTAWDGGLRNIDGSGSGGSDSDSDGEGLNPLEATPASIPEDSFPAGTRFVRVAAGDRCSFAVTDTGLVYGWGTFRVSLSYQDFLSFLMSESAPTNTAGNRRITVTSASYITKENA